MPTSADSITTILGRVRHGDAVAVDELLNAVYLEFHRMASQQMARERTEHTLQPTALVHETYLRLLGDTPPNFENRKHFFGAASEAMRRILVDHARAHLAARRGGNWTCVGLPDAPAAEEVEAEEVLAVDAALERLTEFDERKGKLVRLRFFAGLTIEEAAEVLGISERTVKREWRFAKAWLYRELHGGRD